MLQLSLLILQRYERLILVHPVRYNITKRRPTSVSSFKLQAGVWSVMDSMPHRLKAIRFR